MPQSDIRTVIVSPPREDIEAINVLRTAAAIVVISLLLSAMHADTPGAREPVYTFEVLFDRQPEPIQRMYRELMSSFEEMVQLRSSQGRWPTVRELEQEALPPFAKMPGAPVYSWQMRSQSPFWAYLGRPAVASDPAFLLVIQDKVPHPPGAVLTDFHRVLDDGSVLHFRIMFHNNPKPGEDILYAPEKAGWKQIILTAEGTEQ